MTACAPLLTRRVGSGADWPSSPKGGQREAPPAGRCWAWSLQEDICPARVSPGASGHMFWAFPGHPGHAVQLRWAQRQEGVLEGRASGAAVGGGDPRDRIGVGMEAQGPADQDGHRKPATWCQPHKATCRPAEEGWPAGPGQQDPVLSWGSRGLCGRSGWAAWGGRGAQMAPPRAAAPEPGGRGGAANEFQEVSCEGPEAHKPFTGVSGGETRMQPFIYFGFHFSLLFLTCASRSVTGVLKKQDFLLQWRGTLGFPQS